MAHEDSDEDSGPRRAWGLAALKDLAGRRYDRSVLRRTAVLCVFLVPAYGANFLTYYIVVRLLPAESFGLFYVGNTVENVLFTGSFILNLFFTRYLVSVFESKGPAVAVAALRRVERLVLAWGAAGAAGTCLLLPLGAKTLAAHAPLVAIMVVVETYTSYVADLGRVYFQSLRHTVRLGLYTMIWMNLRLLLCVLGILVLGTVWGAFLGMAIAAALVFAGFHVMVERTAGGLPAQAPPLASPLTLVPIFLGYGLLILIFNLNVLLGYFLLTGDALGIYSASSVFPKAILVVTTVPLQMVFAMMVAGHGSRRDFNRVTRKGGTVALGLAVAAGLVIWLGSPWACGGAWGLKLCEPTILELLLFSIVPLSLLRVFVLLEFARGRDWRAMALAGPVLLYLLFALATGRSIANLAAGFVLFAWATLAFFLCLYLGDRIRRRSPSV